MKLISWNVNGLRACVQKGFLDYFHAADADFFCIQESKLQEGQIALDLPGYHQYWNYAEKKGYSGTAIFAKHEPLQVTRGIGTAICDTEGRVITLEYDSFYLVTCYTPNSQNELGAASLPHGVGRRFPCLSPSARQQKAGHSLRRFKCCTYGD